MARKIYIREIYFYLICLIGIILMIIGVVTLLNGAIDYIKPSTYNTRATLAPVYDDRYQELSEQELGTLIDEEISAALENEKIFAIKALFRGGIFIIIGIPLFVVHWKMAQSIWHKQNNKYEVK